jgi:transposase-like protein
MKTMTIPSCPYCGSTETKFNGAGAMRDTQSKELTVFFEYECEDCGKKFYLED